MEGVMGVYTKKDALTKSLYILYGVQHRGQESSGITAASDNSLRTWKGKGLVSSVFDERYRSFAHPNDYLVIGCASGENSEDGYAPIVSESHERYHFSLALDGFFPGKSRSNEDQFKDTILFELDSGKDIIDAIIESMKQHRDAYYSMVMAVWDSKNKESTLIAARDERGVRPLYIAQNNEGVYFASESAPIDVMEAMGEKINVRKDVIPGSITIVNSKGLETKQVLEPKPAHCLFEWVYCYGSSKNDSGKSITYDRNGYIYVISSFMQNLGPVYTLITKHNLSGGLEWNREISGTSTGQSIQVLPNGYILTGGMFMLDVDFDPGPEEDWHSAGDNYDCYIVKYNSEGYW